MWDTWKGKSSETTDAFTGTNLAVRCYESHPVLKLGKGKLYGGSASYPMVKDADVYVALQNGSTSGKISDPWDPPKVIEVQYAIRDMQAPENVARFKKMVTWLVLQLNAGKTVHVGCIGGHGRTGTVISAIVAELKGEKDAIQWVRKHYCKKAVESKEQVAFLVKHYGVSEVEPNKQEHVVNGGSGTKWGKQPTERALFPVKPRTEREVKAQKLLPEGVTSKSKAYEPIASARSLWKHRKQRQR